MRIALVENEEEILNQLSTLISQELSNIGDTNHQIRTYLCGEDFLADWKKGNFDLILLDIYMKEDGLMGIDVAHEIRKTDEDVLIAFCTTSNEFAAESYEVNARFYLKKPITESNIAQLFKRLDIQAMEALRTITLPNEEVIFARKIIYTDYHNHIVTFYFNDGTNYKLRSSQKEVEDLLLPLGYFCLPNKGLIVNFHEVIRLGEESLYMSNKEELLISRRKYKEIKEAYTHFQFTKMKREVNR